MKEDQIIAENKWYFGKEVTDCFPNMLSRSIPSLERMRELVKVLSFRFVKKGSDILDIGCSRGDAVAPLIEKYGALNRFILIDESGAMADVCKERFHDYINCGIVNVLHDDVTEIFPNCKASVILSILAIQFTPLERRRYLLKDIYNSLEYGGCFIFVEKVVAESPTMDSILVDEYYNMKRQNGYTEEQIQAKRKSLQGTLVPLTANENENMLKQAGFSSVECFWRDLNFAGWLAIK